MRKLAMYLAGCTGAVLVVMVTVSVASGATQEAHEHFALPEQYAMSLLEHATALRAVFALDVAFIVAYTAFFAALAAHLCERNPPLALFAKLGLAAMVLTALLDIVEDHHIVSMLDAAELSVLPTAGSIAFQSIESATKFSVSYVSLFLFGLAIPRTSKLAWALCLFLTAGNLVSAIVGYALPPSQAHAFDSGRWIGFLVGIVLAIEWLRRDRD
jgi:hypothetical protein